MPPDTGRLTFREMASGDLGDMAALLGDPEVMTYYPRPKTRQEAAQWIDWNRRLYRTRGYGLWLLATAAVVFRVLVHVSKEQAAAALKDAMSAG